MLVATRFFCLLIKSVDFLSQGTISQNNASKEKGLGESRSSFFFCKAFLSKIDFKQFLATEKLVKADQTGIFQMSEHACVILKNIWLTLCFLFSFILLYKLSDQ